MNYKNQEKIIAHSIFLLGSIIVLYPFISILFLALSEPGTRVSGFTVPSGIYFDNFKKAWEGITNSSSNIHFKKQFHRWFDAFKTFKLLKYYS